MTKFLRRLWRNDGAAVAPTVALSIVGLVAAGGIAFDYARLVSLDTELQNAADQAALAAAGQLDGRDGACARAAAAASSLLTNKTLISNDGEGSAVEVPTDDVTDCAGNGAIQFYQSYDRVTDTPGDAATADDNAKIVIVSVTPRSVDYALTPIVAALQSGDIGAQAVATLGSAICKTPPVMICNPSETGTNKDFDPSGYIGRGLRLTSVGNGSGTWVPGNFGYLDTSGGSNGAPGLREALGWTAPPGECLASNGVDTKPGASVPVTDALNTRFDIYEGNTSCPSGGACPSSINSVKDVIRAGNANGNNACKLHNQGWQEVDASGQYLPTSATTPISTTPLAMGHPRDMCHAVSVGGSCTGGRIGDGAWDADAYFRANYVRTTAGTGGAAGTRWTAAQWKTNTGLSTTVPRVIAATLEPNPAYASRYNVYLWEILNRGATVDGVVVLGSAGRLVSGNGASALRSYGQPVCSAGQGYGSGQVPDSGTPDRRRLSVAVVNCMEEGVQGSSTGVQVEKWIDIFLVEPSINRGSGRTNAGDIYVEIVREASAGGAGTTAGQVIRRDVPYLIK